MALTTWALARQILDEKIAYILNTDLAFEIDEINGSGIDAENYVEYPQQIVVGSNSIALEAASNAVDYPVVACYEVTSKNLVNDIVDSQDDIITFELVAAVASDAGSIAWAARSAKYLALASLTALEAGIPDAPGATGTCVTYRVDPTNTASGATQPIKDGRLYMSAISVRFDVYTRALINYAPRLIDPNNAAKNPYAESLYDVTAFIPPLEFDVGGVIAAAVNPNNSTTVSVSTAQVAAASNVVINNVTSTYGVDAGGSVSIVNQTQFNAASTTVAADAVTIPITGLEINDLDEWVIIIKTQFNVPIFIPLLWDVT